MKNVTISLPEDIASLVRVEAAKAGKSMSSYIAEILDHRVNLRARQIAAVEAFLALPKTDLTDDNGMLPGREELYEREVLHRHERSDVHVGQEDAAQGSSGHDARK